jgi:hypothetical protein
MSPVLCAAFDGMRHKIVPRQAVICGRLTSEELRVLLERIDRFGLRLVRLDCEA